MIDKHDLSEGHQLTEPSVSKKTIGSLMVSLESAMGRPYTAWYKNCKSVRRRKGKICESCPFRLLIEQKEIVHE